MMHELIGKQVEVTASGISYYGILVEIGETEVHLQAETGWISIPMDQVTGIVAAGE
jgi:hypothetical protein